ncbi:hypothetical protein L3Y34_009628 [Caenorhabditis briggsae]|nr:hypothetical protein L3Y34_009628 [Caenorhabditis briggsae]
MPELVMNRILSKLDYKSIQPLREVCHDIRNFIDNQNPNPKIDKILIACKEDTGEYQIHYDSNAIGLNLDGRHGNDFKKQKYNCRLSFIGSTFIGLRNS